MYLELVQLFRNINPILMLKNVFSILILLNISHRVLAQNNELDKVLNEIRVNNIELKTLEAYSKSERLNIKTFNNLSDPEVSGFYLPLGNHPPGDYTEYQITQSFEFPTVYSARKKLINQQESQLYRQFEKTKQEVLLKAKNHCLDLIYLNKKLQLEQERIDQAKKVFDMIQVLFNTGEASLQELNQAKIGWFQNQFDSEKTTQEQKTVLIALQQLNGGISVTFNQSDFPQPLELESFDSIWAEKVLKDPKLKELEEEKLVSYQAISVSKQMGMPDLMVGYNYQGVPGFDYHGIYGGLSIPLWSNRNKVKVAQAQYESLKLNLDEKTSLYKSEQQIKYSNFQFYLKKYREYENTLDGLSHDLLDAYTKGEITYIQYYMELHFYKQAFDTFLEVEHDLHKLKAELLTHRL